MIFLPLDQTFFSFSPDGLRASLQDPLGLQGRQDFQDPRDLQDCQGRQDPRDLQGRQASRLRASHDDGKDDMDTDVHMDNNADNDTDDDKRKVDKYIRKDCKPFNDHLSCVDNAVYAAP